ncbi:hypothetical protein POM88_044762 [Heracleum sosnowskyi]|uniref:Uncharacterized protein n=1 Tax=Heracleum sosnowskyi TaxID=360622 RepID=A0AAD8M5P1_9APIA|nr:hypothetical protein POM88_044762 [Heracleum sosnowskyi]
MYDSVSVATPESSGDESSGKSSDPPDLDNADVGLIQFFLKLAITATKQNNLSAGPYEAYDPQTMYHNPYFRSAVAETAKVQSQQLPQEAISSHTVNSIPTSTVAMVQQPQLTQMYPQVHVSHYTNIMPYRQFLSPVYVPPMAVPGGSSSYPAYPHPSNGNSSLLMPGPGGSSHLPAGGVKYGMQQFKPVPTGSPNGFGNFAGPNGYAINAPSGSATGLEDSSWMNLMSLADWLALGAVIHTTVPSLMITSSNDTYAETSEIWMSQRDLPSVQSGSYYNVAGQTPHASYLPSHTSHASFNAAAQSSHLQFPGMYHSPQPAGIPSPHHPAGFEACCSSLHNYNA